jgi:hypothetical protein
VAGLVDGALESHKQSGPVFREGHVPWIVPMGLGLIEVGELFNPIGIREQALAAKRYLKCVRSTTT